jgi:Heterokaryon incompatibility protein (HET)
MMDSPTSSCPEKYQYTPLPPGFVFRYLILSPGQGNDALECSLRILPLDENPDYEAISYVWGMSTRNQTILCDGGELRITQSLANVLKRMRLRSEPRALWADSICINQEDGKEKGHQVALMGQIYRAAKRALVYLGDDEESHAKAAVELAEEIDKRIEKTCKRTEGPWALFPQVNPEDPFLSDTRWKSVAALYHSPWFNRGWVIQEAGLAQEGLVIWGQYEISWATLMRVDAWIVRRAPTCRRTFNLGVPALHWYLYFGRYQDEAQFFSEGKHGHTIKLLNTLESARELGLTDARDRIYAFLDLLASDDEGPETVLKLHPDYDQDFLNVYKDFAVQHIHTKRKVEILDYVQHTELLLGTGLPSWIPRWDISLEGGSRLYLPLWPALTDRASSVHVPSMTGNNLTVRAVVLDTVVYVSEVLHPPHITSDNIAKIWKAVAQLKGTIPYPPLCHLHAFIRTLYGSDWGGNLQTWGRSQAAYLLEIHRKTSEAAAIDSQYWEEKAKGGDINIYNSFLQAMLCGKRIFLTQRGYLGTAYAVVREGDQCGIIFGCKTVSVLRRAESEDTYRLLGGAYIVGAALQINQAGFQEFTMLGRKESKDWVDRDVEEEDIILS